ncbi:hypothetical protein F0562_008769 [Nyssa sinensis]|uniref:Condensin complex subunit 2 n=1 Tax=Nyssa sinensis TaxID=561372 RepID=A0A5J5AAT4_9ASTE|nr:hypothetical protein F0562_008769 [Nyssa sinensis]
MMGPKQRAPSTSCLQSPTSPFLLGSNDDQLERAQARAARAAAIRRKAMATAAAAQPPLGDPCLSKEQVIELLQNCIKLACENKINQKNTWELKLIDHLSEIIKVEAEADAETNFRKASCTLEAGVKIYSLRVDSVHSEAYKVLGRMNRAAGEDEQETMVGGDSIKDGQDEGRSKEESERKISPLSTLEPSYESLNVKRFDVAFAVDPLYHQTSAQFDEGGAKGLLLNNLDIYGGCRVLFDSMEVPSKCASRSIQNGNNSNMIDISFAREYIEQMVMNMPSKNEISPTLSNIVCQFNQDNQRPSHASNEGWKFVGRDDAINDCNVELDGNSFEDYEAGTFGHYGETSVLDETFNSGNTYSHEENDPYASYEPDVDDRSEEVAVLLFHGMRLTSKQNAWAGPDHWKFWKPKGLEDVTATDSRSDFPLKRHQNNKAARLDIDFSKSLDNEVPDIFAPPKNPKLLLLPANRVPLGHTLPEDCHYIPEDLVKLFLLPNVMCFGKRRRRLSDDNSFQQSNDVNEQLPSWDNESVFGGQDDDGCANSDLEDPANLVSQPRQVNKIEVQYDKTSKQVDVHVLKETLWDHMQESTQMPETVCKDAISFKHVLATFPDDCRAAAPENISPHLCFICLLHLANEHCLSIRGCPTLDDLSIHLPSSCGNTGEGIWASS